MNYHRVYGLTDYAEKKFNELGTEAAFEDGYGPDECVECGICEEKCPQDIEIINQLKETAAALDNN
jgi:predicted aldo/keto reductase-like oxidoreductase